MKKNSFLILFLLLVSFLYGTDYSYTLTNKLKIYKDDVCLFEVDDYKLTKSKLAFIWKDESCYNCFLIQNNRLIKNIDWAYTNDYGIVFKRNSCFEMFISEFRSKKVTAACDYVIPLPFENYLLMWVDDDFNVKNEICLSNKKIIVNGNDVSCFDGGVVFSEHRKHVSIINAENNLIEKDADYFIAAGQYLWLFYENKIELYDSLLNLVKTVKGSFDLATSFFDEKSVLIDHKKGVYYLFNLKDDELKRIGNYSIIGNQLFYDEEVHQN